MAHPYRHRGREHNPSWAHDLAEHHADGGVVIGHRQQQRKPNGQFDQDNFAMRALKSLSGAVYGAHKAMTGPDDGDPPAPIDSLGIRG